MTYGPAPNNPFPDPKSISLNEQIAAVHSEIHYLPYGQHMRKAKLQAVLATLVEVREQRNKRLERQIRRLKKSQPKTKESNA